MKNAVTEKKATSNIKRKSDSINNTLRHMLNNILKKLVFKQINTFIGQNLNCKFIAYQKILWGGL